MSETVARQERGAIVFEAVLTHTLRVPAVGGTRGDSRSVARQLDVALMANGYKLSGPLLEYVGALHPSEAVDLGKRVLAVVTELIGSHVQHNVYFRDFPENVPDTLEFWLEQATHVFVGPDGRLNLAVDLNVNRVYGRYQHTYEEMLAAHEQLIPSVTDRVTVLHLGKSLPDETIVLYHELASSRAPLSDGDRDLLAELAASCAMDPQPASIPLREHRALINRVRLEHGVPLLVDTVTDVLRLAAVMSDGDVTLAEAPKFRSLPRRHRRLLMQTLDTLVKGAPDKLADVLRYPELWKRLGERLHPHEFADLTAGQDIFATARGERDDVSSLDARIERAYGTGDPGTVLAVLDRAPGVLIRQVDRLARFAGASGQGSVIRAVEAQAGRVSGRVLLSLLEHLENRTARSENRIFANRSGTGWVAPDAREPLPEELVRDLSRVINREIARRLPAGGTLVVDRDVLDVALPLSSKTIGDGFGVLPRGSVMRLDAPLVRFFVYWKQRDEQTDYDLSALMLDQQYRSVGHISYTNLQLTGAVHSGDVVEASDGAFEAIDIELDRIDASYVIPTVNVYGGESFADVEECFFGYMERSREQQGLPFEPRTVRTRSEMRDAGQVALPFALVKDPDGRWNVTWLQLFVRGMPAFNRVEANRVSTTLLTRAILERQYLTISHVVSLLREKADRFCWSDERFPTDGPVTYIGLTVPESLHPSSTTITSRNFGALIPE